MSSTPQFVGAPCGTYGTYTFYKGFKFFKRNKCRAINLGEFFFIRISSNHDPCIGEIELFWTEQNNDQRLASLRLYFLPEQTPEGRLLTHGEHEVLMASDKVVLRLEDVVSWITDEVEWNHGLLAVPSSANGDEPNQKLNGNTYSKEEDIEQEEKEDAVDDVNKSDTELSDTTLNSAQPGKEPSPASVESKEDECAEACEQAKEQPETSDASEKDETNVIIFPYAAYCRYRSMLKRLQGVADEWMNNLYVLALGGVSGLKKNTHILFCKDTFDHEDLANHELNCEYLAPTLKAKRRKRKGKNVRSNSPGSESNTSEESKESPVKSTVNNGFKQPPCKTEQEFLQRLYRFMKKQKTPIHRVPHLGFKQIDLFVFFSFAQKLGGYDKITGKRLWKHVYDVLGGDPGSTSAATCTRRHYEKLLLPFERFMDGKEYKPKQSRKQSKPQKKPKEEDEALEKATSENSKVDNEDAYLFTDSNHENSKDSFLNEEPPSGDELQIDEAYSDEEGKSIWSIQKALDGKEEDQEADQHIKPLIIQKEPNETFSEKERKWNEIRRKNALARKWVRQLRPSRGGKMSGSDKVTTSEAEPSSSTPKSPLAAIQDIVKKESIHTKEPSKAQLNSHKIKREPKESSETSNINCQEKYTQSIADIRKLDFNHKSNFYGRTPESYLQHKSNELLVKSEPLSTDKKSWCGFSQDGAYHVASAPERFPYGAGIEMNLIHNFMKQEYKSGIFNESGSSKSSYLACSNPVESGKQNVDHKGADGKKNLSQRRPSVIQHTEYVTSPSPSQSPKQMSSEPLPERMSRDMHLSFGVNAKMQQTNSLASTISGKVSEWLAKAVPEAVACKTPCISSEKLNELHDKVLMPSSCKTPGPGTGKVPMYGNKNRMDPYAGSSKPVRDRSSTTYREAHIDSKKLTGYMMNQAPKAASSYQKSFLPNASMGNSVHPYLKAGVKVEVTSSSSSKAKMYSSEPLYNQTKRHRMNSLPLSSPLPPRPSLLPFTSQQTYRTSPLSDIPKTISASTSDYNNAVLDLSMKKKPPAAMPVKPTPLQNMSEQSADEAVCLDLTVKRKLNQNSAIENISPPLPQTVQYSSKPLKPLPTLIALQDLMREEVGRQKVSSSSKSTPGNPQTSSALPSNPVTYAASAQNKLPANFISALPDSAFTKEMAKSLYMPDLAQFSPYVIPPFYAAGWPQTNNLHNATPSNSSTTASPNSFKDVISHNVFPKQYMYNVKNPFQVGKDNGCYPPSCK